MLDGAAADLHRRQRGPSDVLVPDVPGAARRRRRRRSSRSSRATSRTTTLGWRGRTGRVDAEAVSGNYFGDARRRRRRSAAPSRPRTTARPARTRWSMLTTASGRGASRPTRACWARRSPSNGAPHDDRRASMPPASRGPRWLRRRTSSCRSRCAARSRPRARPTCSSGARAG